MMGTGARYGALLGLGAALLLADTSVWVRLGVVGAGWLLAGGCHTLYLVARTLPRDLTAVKKMGGLVLGTKMEHDRAQGLRQDGGPVPGQGAVLLPRPGVDLPPGGGAE